MRQASILNTVTLCLPVFCSQAEQLRSVGRHPLLQDRLPETGACQEHADLDLNSRHRVAAM